MLALGFAACNNEDNNEELQPENDNVEVTFVYTLNTSNGNSMTRSGATNEEVFNEFYDKIKTGELVAESYDLTLTNVNTGVIYEFKGEWDSHDLVTMQTGTYQVVGISTAVGANIQEKCSFTFEEQIEITSSSKEIMLHANYDSFLLIFNGSNVKSLENYSGIATSALYTFNSYKYAFVNNQLYNEEKQNEAYLIGTYVDNAEFKIFTGNLNFQKGKYYVFNSVSNDFDLPEMEDGMGGAETEVETFIADKSSHPFYIGGLVHNNNNGIVKKGLIVSMNENNLYYDENIPCILPYSGTDYEDYEGYGDYFEYKIIDCTNQGNEEFVIPLIHIWGNTKYYVKTFVLNNNGDYIYGNTIELISEDFEREYTSFDYANVWYDFYEYTLFDLTTDEYIDYAYDGYYYSTNEYPEDCYFETYQNMSTCYKFKTEWNYKLWYYNHHIHCEQDKIVSVPIMEYKNGKLHINKQEKDADKNVEIYYSINENGRRPETFANKYDAPLDINIGDIVYCYAISNDGYISYTNVYKRFE